jgi:exodeoxyribonuclease VII small subunit
MADAPTSVGAAPGSGSAEQSAERRQDPGFDQILARLREVVVRLESGELSLEQSLMVYEEGVQLARRGQHLLASAERRVEILMSASGGIEVVPFDEAVGESAAAPGAAGGGKTPRAATPITNDAMSDSVRRPGVG